MNRQEWIQSLVVRSNAWWPFSRLNRLPYYFAIHSFTRLCKSAPEIHSAYLRHSVAEGRWEPGLSDIDLTILLKPGMTRDEEFHFLTGFRRAYRRLSGYLPMLGELQALPLEYMPGWCQHSLRGRSVNRWKKLCGSDFRRAEDHDPVSPTIDDRLCYAMYFSVFTFMDRLRSPQWGAKLELEFLRRLLLKIEHFAAPETPNRNGRPVRSGELLYLESIRCIEAAVKDFVTQDPEARQAVQSPNGPERALPVLEDPHVAEALDCLLESNGRYYAILDLDAGSGCLAGCIQKLRDHLFRDAGDLAVLGPRGFAYLVTSVEPYWYTDLACNRTVHHGQDPVPGLIPPGPETFRRRLLAQFSMSSAAFPQGNALTGPSGAQMFPVEVALGVLKQIVNIRLLFERGSPPVTNDQLCSERLARYQDVFGAFEALVEAGPADAKFRLFELLRDQLDVVNAAMSRGPAAAP